MEEIENLQDHELIEEDTTYDPSLHDDDDENEEDETFYDEDFVTSSDEESL